MILLTLEELKLNEFRAVNTHVCHLFSEEFVDKLREVVNITNNELKVRVYDLLVAELQRIEQQLEHKGVEVDHIHKHLQSGETAKFIEYLHNRTPQKIDLNTIYRFHVGPQEGVEAYIDPFTNYTLERFLSKTRENTNEN